MSPTSEVKTDGWLNDLDLSPYLDELEDIQLRAEEDVCEAGESALKTLDRFVANLAARTGLDDERPGIYDSVQHLERIGGRAQSIAVQAERFRATRNALAHNPDLTLRPEAAARIILGVEKIIRTAAQTAYELSRKPPTTIHDQALARDARDLMLSRGYHQLVAVDGDGKLLDLLTDRDIMTAEAQRDLDGNGDGTMVADLLGSRDVLSVAPVGRHWTLGDVVNALADDAVSAAVVTEHGKIGESPLGVITRGDILKRRD